MNIKITHNWLLEYLDTDADPYEIQKYLSLCGPSVERIEKVADDYVYDIEIISNRIDTASVIGIAQEASAILPMFGKKTVLKSNPLRNLKLSQIKEGVGFDLKVDIRNPDLVSRFTSIIYDQIEIKDSPDFIKERLSNVGVKVINNVVDISNYLMFTFGQPIHMFDYDKITNKKMIVRESRKGEKLVTLDKKEITLPGGDVVIEDGSGKLIDLCGIMGGLNSAISAKTKRVLLFVQTYNKSKIRKTTMSTGQRTIAATFFEKGLDEERVEATIVSASELIQKYCEGKVVSKIQDIYLAPYKGKTIEIEIDKFEKAVGVKIDLEIIKQILSNLGFVVEQKETRLFVKVPSTRKYDIAIEEDLVEEVARIYGYHKLPNNLQPPAIVEQPEESEKLFTITSKIKYFLKHLGLNEVINYSMISKKMIQDSGLKIQDHLKLSNTISEDIEYMRLSLLPSLYKNIVDNTGKKNLLKFFEIAKVYQGQTLKGTNPKRDKPCNEIYKLGIVVNTDYFDLKGIVEALDRELNIKDSSTKFTLSEVEGLEMTKIISKNGVFMTEIDLETLIDNYHQMPKYQPINPFAVIKLDKTFQLAPNMTYEVITGKAKQSKLLQNIDVLSVFENKLTLRFYYSSTERNIKEEEAKLELDQLE